MNILKLLVKNFFPRGLLRIIKNKRLEIKGQINEKYYKGGAVLCPCCGKTFDRFMDFTISKLNNYERYKDTYKGKLCPSCFSYPRHRIACYHFDKISWRGNSIILFGAEYSIKKWFDRKGLLYTTADLFDRSANIKADIQNTAFADESWDLIICNHVLEHVPDYKVALKELKRILKNNGILELTVPTDRNFETVYEDKNITGKMERIKAFGQHDHMRIFGNDFEKILIDLGFSVEVIDGNKLPAEIVGVIGPANYDDNRIYICKK
jgi:predicted SAM-dependent methyltransferase